MACSADRRWLRSFRLSIVCFRCRRLQLRKGARSWWRALDFGLTSCPASKRERGHHVLDNPASHRRNRTVLLLGGRLAAFRPDIRIVGTCLRSPRRAGSFPMVVRVMDSVGRTSTQSCQLTVTPSVVQILGAVQCRTPASAPRIFRTPTASGGSQPYAFRIDGKLPSGLTMAANGSVSGLAVSTGTSDF